METMQPQLDEAQILAERHRNSSANLQVRGNGLRFYGSIPDEDDLQRAVTRIVEANKLPWEK